MNESLPLRFLNAIPLRGVAVTHGGNAIALRWSAGTACAVRITPNVEGDVDFPLARMRAVRLSVRVVSDQPFTLRSRVRGAGWLAAHTELWQDHTVPVGTSEIDITTTEFRVCQNDGPAAALQLEWTAPTAGELTVMDITLIEQSADGFFAARVDRFGQSVAGEWAGKVHSDADLQADAVQPLPAPVPRRDRFGGAAEGARFEATGFFRVTEQDGRWWLVTPDGNRFISFGACCVSPGVIGCQTRGREELFAELPPHTGALAQAWQGAIPGKVFEPEIHTLNSFGGDANSTIVNFYIANLIRKWGADWFARWGASATARLRHWGMNTLACWSDLDLARVAGMPYAFPADRVCSIDWGDLSSRGPGAVFPLHNVPDVFHPDFEKRVRGWFRGLAAWRDDPFVIGYFVGNEENWCSLHSPFSLPRHWESRQLFVRELQRRYGTIEKLNAAWGTAFRSFTHLREFQHTENPPGLSAEGTQCCDEFLRRFADRYFGAVRAELRAGDPNHLFLGCRYLALPPRDCLLAGAAPHCDVVSINWYLWHKQRPSDAAAFLGDWSRRCGGKPLLISEYSFTATDERQLACHLPHFNQADRACAAEDFTRNVLRLPFVVGAHWFQYADEPLLGRPLADGERANFGLVDVADRPYPEVTAALRRVATTLYDRHESAGLHLSSNPPVP